MIFFANTVIIVTGIVQLYMAYQRHRKAREEIIPPTPSPPPAERPGQDSVEIILPPKIYVFPTGRVYHISTSCQNGGKEYTTCKLCMKQHEQDRAAIVEHRMQHGAGSSTRSASAH